MSNNSEPPSDRRGVKRKKRKSFLQNAKKYGRKGECGHGSELDADTYQYMIHVLELMRDGFPTFEEKLIFVNNVYEQTTGREVDYARNQVGSRVLDSLMRYANLEALQRLADAFNASLRPMCSDRFASHVLEALVVTCAERGNRSTNSNGIKGAKMPGALDRLDAKESEVSSYNAIALKLSKYVVNNFEDFVRDTYANRVLRTVIETLGGLIERPDDRNDKKKASDIDGRWKVTQDYTDLLLEACRRISKWPQFVEFCQNELTSGLVQVMLYSLRDAGPELSDKIIGLVTKKCFVVSDDELQLSNAFDSQSSARVIEACLANAKAGRYAKIHEKFFAGRLKRLSLSEGANFSVQRLLDHCGDKENFEGMFQELSDSFQEILEKGHTGVLVSLAEACSRLHAKQGAFINAIAKALHCDESAEARSRLATLVVALKTREKSETPNSGSDRYFPIHLHGSLILQAMLRFNKPIKVVDSLLATSDEELVYLFCDPKGSRVMDAFMDSEFIGEKSREKLARKLRGNWAKLACGTHGSRCLDKMWDWSRKNQRIAIMEELASVGQSLNSTKSGKIISAKLNVPLFSRSKKDWSESCGKEEKTKALFADIIATPAQK